jgi:sec-independent protein translocase protein TatB
MFDVGFWEILLILVLALVVLGPERLPQAARSVGYWVGKARRYIEGVKEQVESEFDTSEVKRLLHNQEVQIKELQNKLSDAGDSVAEAYTNDLDDDEPVVHHDEPQQYEILEEDDDGGIEAVSEQFEEKIIEEDSIEKDRQVSPSEKTE